MKQFLLQFFTWWNGQTLGTRFYTWRRGQSVGSDEAGNRYYRNADDSRRWVVYSGAVEASRIAPGWHGWMHRRTNQPPSKDYKPRDWEKPHQPNPTGTAHAYRPPGSVLKAHPEVPGDADYEPWTP